MSARPKPYDGAFPDRDPLVQAYREDGARLLRYWARSSIARRQRIEREFAVHVCINRARLLRAVAFQPGNSAATARRVIRAKFLRDVTL